jgi:hypothetical protein
MDNPLIILLDLARLISTDKQTALQKLGAQ